MIGLSTRFVSYLTEGISANTTLLITKTNAFLNNAQNPVRRNQLHVRTDKACPPKKSVFLEILQCSTFLFKRETTGTQKITPQVPLFTS